MEQGAGRKNFLLHAPCSTLTALMAKCEEGYLCDVCGQDVAELTD